MVDKLSGKKIRRDFSIVTKDSPGVSLIIDQIRYEDLINNEINPPALNIIYSIDIIDPPDYMVIKLASVDILAYIKYEHSVEVAYQHIDRTIGAMSGVRFTSKNFMSSEFKNNHNWIRENLPFANFKDYIKNMLPGIIEAYDINLFGGNLYNYRITCSSNIDFATPVTTFQPFILKSKEDWKNE